VLRPRCSILRLRLATSAPRRGTRSATEWSRACEAGLLVPLRDLGRESAGGNRLAKALHPLLPAPSLRRDAVQLDVVCVDSTLESPHPRTDVHVSLIPQCQFSKLSGPAQATS